MWNPNTLYKTIYIYIHIYIVVNTYIDTYIHTYMHACMHACIHTVNLEEFSEKTPKSSQKIKEIRGNLLTISLIMKAVDILLELALLKLNY